MYGDMWLSISGNPGTPGYALHFAKASVNPAHGVKTDDEAKLSYTVDNSLPRRDTGGSIVNAHQGHITLFPDGRYYWVGSAWIPCALKRGIDGCHVGTTRNMEYGTCGFGNNNISVYSNTQLSNNGWRLETDDALPRATRAAGEYWQVDPSPTRSLRVHVCACPLLAGTPLR